MTSNSVCRECGEAILWVDTPKGKKMPLNVAPVQRGLFIIEGGVTRPISGAYQPHWSTCPHAETFRRRRKEG